MIWLTYSFFHAYSTSVKSVCTDVAYLHDSKDLNVGTMFDVTGWLCCLPVFGLLEETCAGHRFPPTSQRHADQCLEM